MECFMEEVARAAGKDSLAFRLSLMKDFPKHRAVLEAAAEKGDWGKPLPAGMHRGIAQFMGYGSYSAATAEVSVSAKGELKVHRMVLALDCGHAVNPSQIAAQVEGSVAYGLSAMLYGEMNVEKGRMTNLNFDTYELMRLAEFPKVETVIVPTNDFWGGVGEPTICVAAPAVMNAIFAASGWPTTAAPVSPAPLTMLITPGGSPASCTISANLSAVIDVVSAGFKTTVLPQARAGAIFHASISSGKFHGITWPTTPSGATRRPGIA